MLLSVSQTNSSYFAHLMISLSACTHTCPHQWIQYYFRDWQWTVSRFQMWQSKPWCRIFDFPRWLAQHLHIQSLWILLIQDTSHLSVPMLYLHEFLLHRGESWLQSRAIPLRKRIKERCRGLSGCTLSEGKKLQLMRHYSHLILSLHFPYNKKNTWGFRRMWWVLRFEQWWLLYLEKRSIYL